MKKYYKAKTIKIFLFVSLLFTAGTTNAQVGIGTPTPNASAQLDVNSTSKGFLPPRMTQAQRDSIVSPATGLTIYQTNQNAGFYYFNGISWKLISENANQQNNIPIVVTQDDFSSGALKNYWSTFFSGSGVIQFNNNGTVTLATDGTNIGGATIAKLYSNVQKSLNDGTLVFTGSVYTYEDNNIAYGPLSKGLVNGTDRNNAIEFIITDGSTVETRTVSAGAVTKTDYNVGSATVARFYTYSIIASKSKVEFYLDGTLIATHTSNIPTVPLNMYFETSKSFGHNVPLVIDDAKFQIIR